MENKKTPLIDQLVEFYYKYDAFQTDYLDKAAIRRIYEILFNRNRLHIFCDNDSKLLGYGESWRINYDVFGRILCGHNIYAQLDLVDIEYGNIAYLANVTIHPDWRHKEVLNILRNDFFTKNYSCDYFVGHAKRKKTQPVKVFTRQEAFKKWCKEDK